MTDDPREVLTAALDPFVVDPYKSDAPLMRLKTADELADAALAALAEAGYRLVRGDDPDWPLPKEGE